MIRSAAIAFGVAASLFAAAARAEDTVVTLVRPRAGAALVNEATSRLAAELGTAGFSVRVVTSTGGDVREEVERTDPSFATIAIVQAPRGGAIDVWIADRVTGKTVVRRVDVRDPASANAVSELAIRSVELLRASLLEIHRRGRAPTDLPAPIVRFAGPAPQAEKPAPQAEKPAPQAEKPAPQAEKPAPQAEKPAPQAEKPAPQAEKRALVRVAPSPRSTPEDPGPHAGVEAAVSLLASTQGGPSVRPLLRLSVDLPRHLSVRLAVSPSAGSITLSAPQGTVDVHQSVASIDVAYTFDTRGARLRPLVAIGGGVHALRVDGAANPGFTSWHRNVVSGFVSAGAGLGVRLAEGLTLLGDLTVLALLPPRTVSAVGQPLARLGSPAFLPSLGLVADIR